MNGVSSLIADTVRAGDYDRYLSALYAPEEKRASLLALAAFNVEISSVRDRIREPMPGEIRLQWWRDVIASRAAGPTSGHPLADALILAISENNLPQLAFDNYLDARIFDLYNDPMPSRTDLEGYCGETTGALIQLSALILDAKSAPEFAEAAGHSGCAQAITGLMRQLPLHRARGQCYVPRDILAAAGTTPEDFIAGKSTEVGGAVAAMIALANDHYSKFRRAAQGLPATLRPAFLPVALVPANLRKIAQRSGIAGSAPPRIPSWKRHWLLLRAASRGWVS